MRMVCLGMCLKRCEWFFDVNVLRGKWYACRAPIMSRNVSSTGARPVSPWSLILTGPVRSGSCGRYGSDPTLNGTGSHQKSPTSDRIGHGSEAGPVRRWATLWPMSPGP